MGGSIAKVDILFRQTLQKTVFNKINTFNKIKNFSLDLKDLDNCLKVTKKIDYVYNMACNMGGMGFIENNKTECMLSVLINTNLLRASIKNSVSRYFFSSDDILFSFLNI